MRGFPATRRAILGSSASIGLGLLGVSNAISLTSSRGDVSYRWTVDARALVKYLTVTDEHVYVIRQECDDPDAGCPSVTAYARATGERRWQFEASEPLLALNATETGVYAVGLTTLYRLHPTNGGVEWTYALGEMAGTSLEPAMTADAVYVRTRDSVLHAVETATGERRWMKSLPPSVGSPPVVERGIVYLTTHDSGLVAYDAETGAERWTFELEGTVSNPTVAGSTVYLGSDALYALAANTGEERWTVRGGDVGFSPISVLDGVVYSYGGNSLYALDTEAGKRKWRIDSPEGGVIIVMVERDDVLYVVTGNTVSSIDPETGDIRWQPEYIGESESNDVSIHYATFRDGDFYFASYNNDLYALPLEAAIEAWGDR